MALTLFYYVIVVIAAFTFTILVFKFFDMFLDWLSSLIYE